MLRLLLARVIVDVSKRVELVGHDVDVITTYAVTLTSNALALIDTSDGVKLATAHLALFFVEVGGHCVYAGRIAHQNYLVGQLFRLQMKVETRTVGIDNQFGFRKCSFTHRLFIFLLSNHYSVSLFSASRAPQML